MDIRRGGGSRTVRLCRRLYPCVLDAFFSSLQSVGDGTLCELERLSIRMCRVIQMKTYWRLLLGCSGCVVVVVSDRYTNLLESYKTQEMRNVSLKCDRSGVCIYFS